MPWTKSDVDEHKKGLKPAEKNRWVAIANSVYQDALDDGNDEKEAAAMAIRIANAKCKEKGKVQKILEDLKDEKEINNKNVKKVHRTTETIEYFSGEKESEETIDGVSEFNNIDKYIPIAKVEQDKRIVTGIVLEPDTVDLQGDIYDAETIEKAAHNFLKDVRKMGLMHKSFGKDLHVVESYIAPIDFGMEDHGIKKGTWIIAAKVMDDEIWKAIKSKEITGFSIGGAAKYRNL